ncbi:PQQ-dependent sugar dehydrogenase [Marispirochaeta aestuarii]|uniref:PQQ-dependent sugar dehydrogenase n=1 Tax=Marispirochaeta aestuarii TaxID=1963862 RepID=UPI0029C851E3|nr:PQQ-dependent sugar dehydrogenase [Marispirochaeta aestuarii]
MKRIFFLVFLAIIFVNAGFGAPGPERGRIDSMEESFALVTVTEGIPNPWSFTFLPRGDVLITQRSGKLWRVEAASGRRSEVGGLPEIDAGGQGGLLDIVLHPGHYRNGWIYMSHVVSSAGGSSTAVSRARLDGNRLTDLERVFTADNAGSTTRHFGSRLVFDDEGYLYVSLGDRGESGRAQDLSDHAGTLLRLHDDGSIPGDNPYAAVFSYGHRNVQGMVFDPVSREVWAHEHGARGGDEVNIIKRGANYGWPRISYGRHYDGSRIGIGTAASGMEQPLVYWDPSIAPSGMAVYTGDAFPSWKGDIFVGALAGQHLRRLVREGSRIVSQEVLLEKRVGRIRDVRQGPEGALYILTDERNGSLYRLEPLES